MDEEKDTSLEDLITVRAIQIGSLALITDDPAKLARINIAMTMLSISSSMQDVSNIHRLINTANRLK
jgi:hypothetical protein